MSTGDNISSVMWTATKGELLKSRNFDLTTAIGMKTIIQVWPCGGARKTILCDFGLLVNFKYRSVALRV